MKKHFIVAGKKKKKSKNPFLPFPNVFCLQIAVMSPRLLKKKKNAPAPHISPTHFQQQKVALTQYLV